MGRLEIACSDLDTLATSKSSGIQALTQCSILIVLLLTLELIARQTTLTTRSDRRTLKLHLDLQDFSLKILVGLLEIVRRAAIHPFRLLTLRPSEG